jgi:hypothetical protein
MANWELQCVSAIVKGAGGTPSDLFEAAQLRGIRFSVFGSIEARALWSSLEAHYTRPGNFGHIPSEVSIQEMFPTLALPQPLENFQDLCRKVIDGWSQRESKKYLDEYLADMGSDTPAAITALYEKLGELQEQSRSSSDVHYREVAMRETLADLTAITAGGGLTGMPWPWTKLNLDTGGIQRGDFIMVWALPKTMKTWWGLIVMANLFMEGKRILIYSKEMLWDSMRTRINCLLAEVDYGAWRRGELSARQQMHLLSVVERMADPSHTGELFFTNADRPDGSPGGPNDIRRKIDLYKPHAVLLDSSYMLEMPNAGGRALDWNQLALVSRQLKQVAKTTGIPLIALLQENERAAMKYTKSRGTASIAMNSGAVMDCDLGLRLVRHRKLNELSIHYAACRETDAEGFTIHALPAHNFKFAGLHLHGVGDDSDAEEEKTRKAAEKAKPKAMPPRPEPTPPPPTTPPAVSLMDQHARGGNPAPSDSDLISELDDDLAEGGLK